MTSNDTLRQILDLARWAPSGDNTQPWRFQIVDSRHVVVHGFDTREHCVYDLDGHPSQISIGALLETTSIAASKHGLRVQACRRADSPVTNPVFDLHFYSDPSVVTSPLCDSIERRSVQRRPLSMRTLTDGERQALNTAAGPKHDVIWLEGPRRRLQAALLMFHSAKLRLTMPEAYEVHRDIIEWNAQFSRDRVPDQALGTDPGTTRLMQFVMHDWKRVEFFNRYLAGTWAPRIQLDLLPSLACAAHFVICAKAVPKDIDDYIEAGRTVQRFWLTATSLGLQLQPEVTPLVFARYAREQRTFSKVPGMSDKAAEVGASLDRTIGASTAHLAVFMGRIGAGRPARARSIRKPLSELLMSDLGASDTRASTAKPGQH
ncbi:nitroreductase family protein [Paucibacter soli]|uniref:nitroreductase family protein n=1 Tax=Paucibacter soli TaxID=3133433 RepID=UPI0030A59AE3